MTTSNTGRAVLVAAETDTGERLDRFIAARMAEVSRSRIAALMRAGHVAGPAGTIVEPAYRVKPGDRFEVTVPEPVPPAPRAEPMALDILYEDGEVIVIDKPAGLVVHPGAGNHAGTLVNALIAHCGSELSGIGGVKRPGIVHRLDKDTSGIMVAAKTERAHQALARQFADHGRTGPLARAYLALVWGVPRPRSGLIDRPLGRDGRDRTRQRVVAEGRGRAARTRYEVVETYPRADEPMAALVRCRLETGRTHQIRVHLAAIGTPVIGDGTYGPGFRTKAARLGEGARAAVEALGRQALHAAELCFAHPATGEAMEFRSEPPTDMARLAVELSQE